MKGIQLLAAEAGVEKAEEWLAALGDVLGQSDISHAKILNVKCHHLVLPWRTATYNDFWEVPYYFFIFSR